MLLKETFILRAFGFAKVPLLYWAGPVVEEMSDHHVVVSIPFQKRNKNHVGSLYFGALCIGADCAGGILAMKEIQKQKGKWSFVFKDLQAQFLKRAEGKTFFTCKDGDQIKEAVRKASESMERTEIPVTVIATVPQKSETEPVAEFKLTLSMKRKS